MTDNSDLDPLLDEWEDRHASNPQLPLEQFINERLRRVADELVNAFRRMERDDDFFPSDGGSTGERVITCLRRICVALRQSPSLRPFCHALLGIITITCSTVSTPKTRKVLD